MSIPSEAPAELLLICFNVLFTCAVAEDIGVCAEPEVEVRQLTPENPFMVIASDGVFEFLTNQEVINMVSSIHKAFQRELAQSS